jgi:hypothetical protein
LAFARASSLLDTDVSAVLCDDDYGNPVTVFADLDSSIDSNEPDVAFVGGPGIWVLVLSRTTGGYTGCRYHLHPRGSLTLGSSLTAFNTPGTERETRPRVGGSRRETGASAIRPRSRATPARPASSRACSIR